MKNTNKNYNTKKFYAWYNNSYIFDKKSKKQIIIKDCLLVQDYHFKQGEGTITTLSNFYEVYYYSKLSKKGFEYDPTNKKKLVINA